MSLIQPSYYRNEGVSSIIGEDRLLHYNYNVIRDEVTGEWRKLHNEELRDLYSLPSIIRIIKSRRMR
jgi:hypothetical protein